MPSPISILCGLVLAFVNNPPDHHPTRCDELDTPGTAARCALRNSARVEIAGAEVDVARARRDQARVMLPSNPTLDVVVAHRSTASDRDVNVYGTLRQEVEIAGQRRLRVRAADAEIDAARADVTAARRRIAADAMLAWYDVVAAQRLAGELGKVLEVARSLESLAAERVGAGAAAGLELDLSRAARIVASRRHLDARRAARRARARLGGLLGADGATLEVAGELQPIARPREASHDADEARARPELVASDARIRGGKGRIAALRRDRVPDPAFVVTVQRDGFGELVAGGGISLGIPLPSPLGRTARAEIAESRAMTRRAQGEREVVRRRVALEVETATTDLEAGRELLAVYDAKVADDARATLAALTDALAAGQVDLRDALMAQQSLLELLSGQLQAEYEVCTATVELAYAAGDDLEGVR